MQKYFDEFYTEIIEEDFVSHGTHLMLGDFINEVVCGANGVQVSQGNHVFEVDYVILAAGFVPNTAMILDSCNFNSLEHNNTAIIVNEQQLTNI